MSLLEGEGICTVLSAVTGAAILRSSYWQMEVSDDEQAPVELYDFRCDVQHWRYTTANVAVVYGGFTYTSEYLLAGDLEQASESMDNTLEIETRWSNPLARLYIAAIPDGKVHLTIYRGHGDHFVSHWVGRISSVAFQSGHKAIIRCLPEWNQLDRANLTLRWGRQCQVPLYSTACGVDRSLYRVTGGITMVDGVDVTCGSLDSYTDTWFNGGPFYANGYSRIIETKNLSTVTLSSPIPGLAVGMPFECLAGCDHLCTTCKDKFDNLLNFQGQPGLPTQNPFGSGGIG